MAIFSFDDFVKQSGGSIKDVKTITPQVSLPQTAEPQKPGYVSRVLSTIGEEAGKAVGAVEKGAELIQEGETGLGLLRGAIGPAAATARAIFSPLTEALAPVVEDIIKKSGITDNQTVKETIKNLEIWSQQHPDAAENLKDIFDIVTSVTGTKIAGKGIEATVPILKESTKEAIKVVGKTTTAATEAISGAATIAKQMAGGVSRIPARISTNIAEQQAKQAVIEKLPSKVAKQAALDGLEPTEINFLYSVPKESKTAFQTLAKTTKEFAEGTSKTNPIEIVGKPIVNRIKELESARGTIGKQLGEVAETLGQVTTKDVAPIIFAELKRVPGLEGITLSAKGSLGFSNTTLATAATRSDRSAIQKIFKDAIKSGTGKQKHLLRQELFEVLGGKKRAQLVLTDTQEKAYQAIRSGLSKVLENKNVSYKTLSNQYRKVMRPLTDIRKFMKNVAGADEDILNMTAGLIARRITSFAPSNPQIRQILRSMDEATTKKGISRLKVEQLQDFYNILDKYYDIAAKTGFQAQVKAGVEKAGGVLGIIREKATELIGQTPAVRQKALERILDEALGPPKR